MAEFSVQTNAVKTAAAAHERLRRELEDVRKTVRGISGSLVLQTAASAGIRRRLGSLAERIEGQRNSMGSMKGALERVAALYEEAERNICGYPKGGVKSAQEKRGSPLWDNLTKWAKNAVGAIGAVVGGILSPVTSIWSKMFNPLGDMLGRIGKGNSTNKPPSAGWLGKILGFPSPLPPITNDRWIGSVLDILCNLLPPQYEQPKYTQQDLARGADGNYSRTVYWSDGTPRGEVDAWNDNAQTQLSCTYYTLRKLKEQGLSYPCEGGPGDGRSWYENRDKGWPHAYGGNNALEDLVNGMTLPQANIVVSFNGGRWGHVLLIDQIYRDENGTVMVQFSDMYSPKNITTLNGDNEVQEITLDAFNGKYSNDGYSVNGAVVIGAGNQLRDGYQKWLEEGESK